MLVYKNKINDRIHSISVACQNLSLVPTGGNMSLQRGYYSNNPGNINPEQQYRRVDTFTGQAQVRLPPQTHPYQYQPNLNQGLNRNQGDFHNYNNPGQYPGRQEIPAHEHQCYSALPDRDPAGQNNSPRAPVQYHHAARGCDANKYPNDNYPAELPEFERQLAELEKWIDYRIINSAKKMARFRVTIPVNQTSPDPILYYQSVLRTFNSIVEKLKNYDDALLDCLEALYEAIDTGYLESFDTTGYLVIEMQDKVSGNSLSLRVREYLSTIFYNKLANKTLSQQTLAFTSSKLPFQPTVGQQGADYNQGEEFALGQITERLNWICNTKLNRTALQEGITELLFDVCTNLKHDVSLNEVILMAEKIQKLNNSDEVINEVLEDFCANMKSHMAMAFFTKAQAGTVDRSTPRPQKRQVAPMAAKSPAPACNPSEQMRLINSQLIAAILDDDIERSFHYLAAVLAEIRGCNELKKLTMFTEEVLNSLHQTQYGAKAKTALFKEIAIRDVRQTHLKSTITLINQIKSELRKRILVLTRCYVIKVQNRGHEAEENAAVIYFEKCRKEAVDYCNKQKYLMDVVVKNKFNFFFDWIENGVGGAYVIDHESSIPGPKLQIIDLEERWLSALIYEAFYTGLSIVPGMSKPAGKVKRPAFQLTALESLRRTRPFANAEEVEINDLERQVIEVKKQYLTPEDGLPVRVFSTLNGIIEAYFDQTRKFTDENRSEKVNDDDLSICRPATFIWQGAPIVLYRNVSDANIVFMFDRSKVQPLFIYKENAFTDAFCNKHKAEDVNKAANDRQARGRIKRLKDISSLNFKMEELTERFNPKENKSANKTSGHYDVKSSRWIKPQKVKSRNPQRQLKFPGCLNHNEVVLAPIPPHHITGTVHVISPSELEPAGNLSIFKHLFSFLDKHKQAELKLQGYIPDGKILYSVYSPYHARLMEVGYLKDMLLPEIMPDNSNALTRKLTGICNYLRVNRHTQVEHLLIRTPLKLQVHFLLSLEQTYFDNTEEFANFLWDKIYSKPLILSTPSDLSSGIQQIIDHFYYLPCSKQETLMCLNKNCQPYDLPDKRKPESGAVCAVFCESLCQLLETQGVLFSPQEKQVLIYTVVLLHAARSLAMSHVDAHTAWEIMLRGRFSGEIMHHFGSIFANLDACKIYRDQRLQMISDIIQMSIQLPFIWCKGSKTTEIRDDLLNDEIMNALRCPKYLTENEVCKSLFHESMHGMIDLMETLGFELVKDVRSRGFYSSRFSNLVAFDQKYRVDRIEKIRRVGGLWENCKNQLKENAARQLCYYSGIKTTTFTQLKSIRFEDSYNTLDYLCISSKDPGYQESLKPMIDLIRETGVPKPVTSITHEESEFINSGGEHAHAEYNKYVNQSIFLASTESYSKSLKRQAEIEKNNRLKYPQGTTPSY